MAIAFLNQLRKLKKSCDEMTEEEIDTLLQEVMEEIEDTLTQRIVKRELLEQIQDEIREIRPKLDEIEKSELKSKMAELDDISAEFVDFQVFTYSGTEEYLRNVKKAEEEEKQEENDS